MSENKNRIDRRDFLKLLGGGAAVTTAALVGCDNVTQKRGGVALGELPTDQMTYRTNPTTGDKDSDRTSGVYGWSVSVCVDF